MTTQSQPINEIGENYLANLLRDRREAVRQAREAASIRAYVGEIFEQKLALAFAQPAAYAAGGGK